MTKKFLFMWLLIVTVFTSLFFLKISNHNHNFKYGGGINQVELMPIVTDDPYTHLAFGGVPNEQREAKFRKWLSVSMKIQVSNGSGSGTIIYFDDSDGYAYVQSCGHLWSGNMTSEEAKNKKVLCKIITWYHNEKKLDKPLEYEAEVLYFSNTRGEDCSLLRFKPNWIPNYIPIASHNFDYINDMKLHSCGCDSGNEVAHYEVRYLGHKGSDIVTTENSPRPGRSGGGLMSGDLFVGICWGTTDVKGTGNGLFTPLSVLRNLNEREGFGWLNDVSMSLARKIPIIDKNNPQGKYPLDYIPIPNNRK